MKSMTFFAPPGADEEADAEDDAEADDPDCAVAVVLVKAAARAAKTAATRIVARHGLLFLSPVTIVLLPRIRSPSVFVSVHSPAADRSVCRSLSSEPRPAATAEYVTVGTS